MPDFSHEDAARALGFRRIAGVDEVGRGPWAGPVVAAAALLDATTLPDSLRQQLDDSKKLSASRRQAVLQALTASPGVVLAVAEASVAEIDASNILAAALLAMTRAVAGLPEAPDFVLVDGNHLPPALPCAAEAVIGGDGRSLSIAAASIAAKVHRDRLMAELAKRYPGYGWERNAGYGTQQHQQALASLGVTPEHRRSFRPVAKILR